MLSNSMKGKADIILKHECGALLSIRFSKNSAPSGKH